MRPFLSRWRTSRWLRAASVFACLLMINLLAVGTSPLSPAATNAPPGYPPWWFEQDVIPRIDPTNQTPDWNSGAYPAPDDYAMANLGQLKYVASRAAAEMDLHLTGSGAGDAVHALIAQWRASPPDGVVRDDYAALNLGQLKAVAQVFYDQLIAAHYCTAYPWASGNADDYAAANLGQIKYLFSFDLTYSSQPDGVPDWWKLAAGLSPSDPTATSALTGNNTLLANGQPMTYFEAFQLGYDPFTAATSDPANNPVPGQGHPLTDLGTTAYAAIDVSSAYTQNDVGLVAIDDSGQVGFEYGSNYDVNGNPTMLNTAYFSQGHATTGRTLAAYSAPTSGGGNVRSPTNVNASGHLGSIAVQNGIAYSDVDGQAFGPDPTNYVIYGFASLDGGTFVGNNGFVIGWLEAGGGSNTYQWSLNLDFQGDGYSIGQWFDPVNQGLEYPYTAFEPYIFSPGGTAVGGYGQSEAGQDIYAVGTYANPTSIERLSPLAVNDKGQVVGDDESISDGTDSLSIRFDGTSAHRLSSLLPSQYANKIRFPRGASEAWINNNGDIIVAGSVFDDSGPNPSQANNWVPKTLLWRNALNLVPNAPPQLSFVSFPDSLWSRNQFNADCVFAGIMYESDADHMAAAALLPVDITVRKMGQEAPADGLVAKTGDVVEIRLDDVPPEHSPLSSNQLVWESRQLRGDGSWGNTGSFADDAAWQTIDPTANGIRFDYNTTQGGIFQLRAKLTVGSNTQTYYYVRKQDVQYATNSKGEYNETYRKGKNDYFGVADADSQIALQATAKGFLGQTIFSTAGNYPFFSGCPNMKGKDKCNLFVYLMGTGAGTPVPRDVWWYSQSVWMPPLAVDWFTSSQAIQNWAWMSETTFPQPGFVVSHVGLYGTFPFRSSVHHSGILDYDGGWINAGELNVNKWPHISTTPLVIPGHYRKFTGGGSGN